MTLIDAYGRRIDYLRLSVTDRCNLRCTYCMPPAGVPKLHHGDVLGYEELLRVARAAVGLGIRKIRVTGGEPLVRRGLVGFLARLAALPGLRELVLTTNGLLLEELALPLRQAGVARLNVSLDSLRPETFAAVTRGGDLGRVLAGIEAAGEAGFPPVKINTVVMRGVNDDEVADFAALTLERPWTVRFIEYMPTMRESGWERLAVSGAEVLARVAARWPLLPEDAPEMAGPARNFRITGARGAIGIITPVSGHFCGGCNRVRVTAAGLARGCLFGDGGGIDLKPWLRRTDDGALREALRRVITGKPDRHRLTDTNEPMPVPMYGIGG